MKKTKIEQRIENALNAFFDESYTTENNSLTYTNNACLMQEDSSKSFTEKADFLVTALKQVFFFFPGTFFLYFISFAFTITSINNPFNATLSSDKAIEVTFLFLSSILFTWFGIGDIKKPKHFIIPVSIIATGAAIGAISGILSNLSHQIQNIVWNNFYPIYFLPLALIVPFLAKGWIDREETDK